jgi:hypothetical protein
VAVNSTAALLLLALVSPDKEMAAVLFLMIVVKVLAHLLLLVVAAPLLADSTAQCLAEEMVVLAHNAWPLAQRLGTLEAEEALLSLFRTRTCLEESEALAAEAMEVSELEQALAHLLPQTLVVEEEEEALEALAARVLSSFHSPAAESRLVPMTVSPALSLTFVFTLAL